MLPADTDSSRWLDVELPRDSPVLAVSFSLAPSTSRVRGASIALDLHASLVLRNTSTRPLAGLTLRVDAQDLLPAGKGSVMVQSSGAPEPHSLGRKVAPSSYYVCSPATSWRMAPK